MVAHVAPFDVALGTEIDSAVLLTRLRITQTTRRVSGQLLSGDRCIERVSSDWHIAVLVNTAVNSKYGVE